MYDFVPKMPRIIMFLETMIQIPNICGINHFINDLKINITFHLFRFRVFRKKKIKC